jgi:hypothetical protein
MSKQAKQNVLIAVAGFIFLFAGFRDLFRPGVLTLDGRTPGKPEIGLAMGLGLFFLGVAGFRTINSKSR